MFKRIVILALLLSLTLSSAALAATTNRDMQLMGGVVVSNATDSFFFCPMEEGVTKHWGLYALSTASSGPIIEIQDGYPARLIHADAERIYFMGYTDANRTVHALYSVTINGGEWEELLTNVKSAFVNTDDEFLYVSLDDEYMLRSYNLTEKKSTDIKSMENSSKTIYDAGVYDGEVYFITKAANGTEDAYQYHKDSGKATNLDKPSPAVGTGLLYEGFRLYSTDSFGNEVYSMKIGEKNSTRIATNYPVTLTSPRFSTNLYAYDGEANTLLAFPLDGSSQKSITLDGPTMARMVLGGTKDELLLINDEAIYSLLPDLSSKTRLFDFNSSMGAQVWSYVAPAGSNAVFVGGYDGSTYTHAGNMLPTGVYVFDRATGNLLFSYPQWDANSAPAADATNEGGTPAVVVPDSIGDVPVEEREEGETYFVF